MFVGVGVSLFMGGGMGCMGKMWEIEAMEALVLVWVESRGVCRIREIVGEGKERKRDCGMEKSSNFSMELCWWL